MPRDKLTTEEVYLSVIKIADTMKSLPEWPELPHGSQRKINELTGIKRSFIMRHWEEAIKLAIGIKPSKVWQSINLKVFHKVLIGVKLYPHLSNNRLADKLQVSETAVTHNRERATNLLNQHSIDSYLEER